MVDLLKTADEWREAQRKTHMTSPVTYSRGPVSVSVLATVGRTVFEVQRADGVHVETQSRDYIITVADLVLDAELVEPRCGDQIVEDAAPGLTYEVVALDADTQGWSYSDLRRLSYRAHTKLVGAE